ncbi:MAG: hypothetical protein LLG04_09710 [Parachlamydia sp.]|nr:hypothetical protein [Parachlamydia sp.]
MNLSDIRFSFNRALSLTFSRKKLLLVFSILALCGLMVVFFRALAINAGQWTLMSLSFLPVFLCAGILLSTGVILVRIYHDEVKQRPMRYRDIMAKSWETAIGSSYFSIPIILCYLLLWMLLGIFVLLKEIPGVGDFFAVILAFGPFLINLGSLVLGLLSISMLFFVAPVIGLHGFNRLRISQIVMRRLKGDMFSNIFLALIATLPLLFFISLLVFAAFLTGNVCYACENPMHQVLQWFIVMIPFTAILAPAVVFFFNFAAEAHVLIQRQLR